MPREKCPYHGKYRPCEHIPECNMCAMEEHEKGDFGEYDAPIYYASCFYCLLEGKSKLECEWDSYGEVVGQVMEAFHIGFRDGKFGKPEIDGSNCEISELEDTYLEGYKAGVNDRCVSLAKETLVRRKSI